MSDGLNNTTISHETFWPKVDVRGPYDCWPWLGRVGGGIGRVRSQPRRATTAQRAAFELARGPVPRRVKILRSCGNPLCVNPAHLFPAGAPELVEARLLARIDKAGPDECWPVTKGAIDNNGYGQIYFTDRIELAHRAAYRLWVDPGMPRETVVRHSCDNPPCCNPAHLRPGTQADNVRDMFERGRQGFYKGEAAGRSKLTERDVLRIRDLYREARALSRPVAPGALQRIAAQYPQVHPGTVRAACYRQSWRHLP